MEIPPWPDHNKAYSMPVPRAMAIGAMERAQRKPFAITPRGTSQMSASGHKRTIGLAGAEVRFFSSILH